MELKETVSTNGNIFENYTEQSVDIVERELIEIRTVISIAPECLCRRSKFTLNVYSRGRRG